MPSNKKKILVSGGGTSGHIYPLIEVVDFLKKRHPIESLYVGGQGNIEEELVPGLMSFKAIPVGKLRRHITALHLRDSARLVRGLFEARSIIKKFKPDIVFTKGGYVSFPIIVAASRANIPVVFHESDIVMGLANRLACRVASKICVGFPVNNYPKIIADKIVYTGNPIRSSFFKKVTVADRKVFSIKKDFPVVLITAGSQGAVSINEAIKPILKNLLRRAQIIHLTGRNSEDIFAKFKTKLPKHLAANYHPFGYLNNGMESAVKVATLVVARAGSTTAELTACGKPMILIPLPSGASNHQVRNAEFFAKEGAAISLNQHHLTSERLLRTINSLLEDEHRLKDMSARSRKLARTDAVDKIVRILEEEMYRKK
jgi:UDP-N-acetylglucosamine--N-acetylmuramyl-(pentapeptide) pyrophosphoryl-undecaprenol N-acetylglucosamine transferase